ncbi:DUF2017 family protein [Micropruina sp.]|uniref:DUF2017 family protein n=1 Tax=Micropruina sp. TaxID=2737536 RepID=UPI002630F1DA|nr:DUF2017 family protein [Micropruina sp.]
MSRFKHSGRQVLLVDLADYEEAVLESMVEQLIGLLEGDDDHDTGDDPFAQWEADMAASDDLDNSDPVIARLFPPAYRGDDKAEQEFRRFTQNAQRRTKIEQAQLVLDALLESNGGREAVVVRAVDADAWLKTITAIRLALSVRLGIRTAEDIDELERLDPDEPRGVLYGMYEWLAGFLDGLVGALH